MEWLLVKTLLSLAAVLGLMVGVVYVLKKYVYRGAPGGAQEVPVEILGQRSLHPKRSIVVIKVLDTVFVVGMSEQGMQTIGTIENEESLAALEERRSAVEPAQGWNLRKTGSPAAAFANQLQESLKGFLHRGTIVVPPTPGNGHSTSAPRRPRRRQ